ncbi:MAG TPA: lamin tail domain-containing protein [bacterium]|jgi:hypothetical protein
MKSFRLVLWLSMIMLAGAGAAWAGLHDAPYSQAFLTWPTDTLDWTLDGCAGYTTGHDAPNSVKIDATGDHTISPTIDNPDTMKVWLKGNSTSTTGTFKIYAQQGTNGWVEIRNCSFGTGADIRNGSYAEVVIPLAAPFRGAQDVSFKFIYEVKVVGNVALDDFSVTAVGVDTTPPSIAGITVVSTTAINVLFSEPVDLTTSQAIANYTVDHSVGHPLTATRDNTNTALVHLTFNNLASNSYVLTVNGVADLSGNPASNATGGFAINGTINAGDVVINEIMYDDTASTDIEWVELHNRTAGAINISGWILTDAPTYPPTGAEGAIQVPQGNTIPAHGYAVLSRDVAPGLTGYIQCVQYFGAWALGNTGDNLALYTDSTGGMLVDGSLTTNYPDLAAAGAGNSIEKCDENTVWSPDSSAWHISTNVFAAAGRYRHCTPGAANTACVVDNVPPTLLTAVSSGVTQVDVTFSEDVDQATSETVTNYSVNNGAGTPTGAVRQANTAVVRLTFASALTPNTYTLTVNNVRDLAGNAILPNSQIPFSVVPRPANFIFTEFMANPNMPGLEDSLGEWFEIYNAGNTSVNLNGWLVCDNAGCDSIEGNHTINPGQYFVFCSNGDGGTNGGVPYDYAYQYGTSGWGLSLNNTGDSLTVKDANGTIAATLTYTASFPFSEGRAAQLRDLSWSPSVDTNWCRADTSWAGAYLGDKGTPQHASICMVQGQAAPYTICDIRQQDQFGISQLDLRRVITTGVVTYEDSCRRNAYIELNGCGVMIYGNAVRDTMQNGGRRLRVGDLVQLEGYLKNYRGLTEIDSSNNLKPIITLLAQNHVLPLPVTVSPSQVSTVVNDCSAEQFESRHVRIQNMTFQYGGDSTFAAGTSGRNYLAWSGTDTVIFRVVPCDTLVGTLIPAGPVTFNAIVSQFDASSPYCGGYQLVTGRIAPFTSGQCEVPVQFTALRDGVNNRVLLRWQPGVNQQCDCYEIWSSTDGGAIFPNGYTLLTTVTGTTQYTDASTLATRRFYVVRAGGPSCP